MSDLVASWLRTVVPTIWAAAIGALLAWLGTHAGWVLDVLAALNIDPSSAAFTAGVVTLVLAGWYAGWRKLEPYIPDWLTRLVLGSAAAPLYVRPGETAAVAPKGARITVEHDVEGR